MRVYINKIKLLGTSREFSLRPGLNIITGSITTGKTTLIKCLRGLLGSNLKDFSREARNNITHLAGEIFIGDNAYEIIRPFVMTNDAMVKTRQNVYHQYVVNPIKKPMEIGCWRSLTCLL